MFSENKILQIIGYLLSLNGNRLNLLKLMKELYLIDRESIKETNFSISGDTYFSLPNGPILSYTMNLLYDLGNNKNNFWNKFLDRQKSDYYPDIIMLSDAGDDYLSDKDKEYIKKISDEFKNVDEWEIREHTHALPEWKDPANGRRKIRYKDIMLALNKTEEEIKIAKEEYEALGDIVNLATI